VRDTGEQDEYYDDSFSPRYSSPPLYEPRPWGEPQWEPPAQDVTTQLPRYTYDDQPTVATPAWPVPPEPTPVQASPPAPPAVEPEPSRSEPTQQPTVAEPVYGMPPDVQRETGETRQEPDPEATQAIPAQPPAPEAPSAREPADEDELADELAVEEHTQELPRITDESERPRN
jgi:hypothetical protein